MIEIILYARKPPHFKRSVNQSYLENGTYEQIVRPPERQMELNGLESEETGVKTQITVIKNNQKTNQHRRKHQHQKQCRTTHCKTTNVVIVKVRGTRQQTAQSQQNVVSWKKSLMLSAVRIVTHQHTKNQHATSYQIWKIAPEVETD